MYILCHKNAYPTNILANNNGNNANENLVQKDEQNRKKTSAVFFSLKEWERKWYKIPAKTRFAITIVVFSEMRLLLDVYEHVCLCVCIICTICTYSRKAKWKNVYVWKEIEGSKRVKCRDNCHKSEQILYSVCVSSSTLSGLHFYIYLLWVVFLDHFHVFS